MADVGTGLTATRLSQLLKQREKEVLDEIPKATKSVADWAVKAMKERTIRGTGLNERRFKPYRPATAKRKRRSQPVTLVETGRMLRDLHVQDRGRSGYQQVIKFASTDMEHRGRFHQFGTRKMAARPWFGLTTRERRKANDIFRRTVIPVVKRDRRFRNRIVFFT